MRSGRQRCHRSSSRRRKCGRGRRGMMRTWHRQMRYMLRRWLRYRCVRRRTWHAQLTCWRVVGARSGVARLAREHGGTRRGMRRAEYIGSLHYLLYIQGVRQHEWLQYMYDLLRGPLKRDRDVCAVGPCVALRIKQKKNTISVQGRREGTGEGRSVSVNPSSNPSAQANTIYKQCTKGTGGRSVRLHTQCGWT